jgi:disulfide bond formation protein DsbB
MSRSRQAALLLLLASAALWGGALFFQYVVGLAPCELCLLQRWPHKIVIVLALLALFAGDRASTPWLLALCGAVLAAGAAIAFYHAGVEQHWFAGPTACTGAPQSAATVEELKRQIMGQQPVRCDRIAWSLFGISMAGWNFLASTALAVFAFAAAAHLRRPRARTA